MSGYASNIYYIDDYQVELGEESAGKIGAVIGAIVSIAIPFAAPAIWGALASSTAIGAGISAALTGAFGATAASVIGSAAVGAAAGALNAYASGARGADVWRAAGMAGISSGIGGYTRAATAATAVRGAGQAAPGVNAIGGTGPVSLQPTAANLASTANTGTATMSGSAQLMDQVNNIFSGGGINQIGRALTNAIVNGESQERINALAAQQRAALQSLSAQEQAAYSQRMQTAQQILADADRMDPAWQARVRMADIAGMEANAKRQAMRNIATRQGGSLDTGQRKAYERSSALKIARDKVLGYTDAYTRGQAAQNATRAQGAGLLNGPSFAAFNAGLDLESGVEQATRANQESTWGGFTDAIFGTRTPAPSVSPDNSVPEDEDGQVGIFGGRS